MGAGRTGSHSTTLTTLQHWGSPAILHHPDLAAEAAEAVYKGYRINQLFDPDMVKDQTVQSCLNRGVQYEKHKKEIIGD